MADKIPDKTSEKTPEKKTPAAEAKAPEPPKVSAAKQRELDAAIATITKAYGEGAIMRLGAQVSRPIEVIPTGALAIDLALGVGGVPRGRVIEIYGPESSGKTTLMLHLIANAQKAGGMAAFIDAEHALDPAYAKKLGVNVDELLVSQPDSGEEALTICETLARSGALDIIVVDSVAALVPKAELEGEMGMATMGMQARLMSQALRKLTAILNKAKTTCLFTNQMREKVGVMFGSPETTPGGKALKFYASVRIDIRRKEAIKDASGAAIGNHVKVKIVRTRWPRPSPRPSSTSSSTTASTRKVPCSTWPSTRGSSRRRGPGSSSRASSSVRARTPRAAPSPRSPSWRRRSRRPRWPSGWPR